MNSTPMISCTSVSKNGRRAEMSKPRRLATPRPMTTADAGHDLAGRHGSVLPLPCRRAVPPGDGPDGSEISACPACSPTPEPAASPRVGEVPAGAETDHRHMNTDLARWQFAFTSVNHFLFVPVT